MLIAHYIGNHSADPLNVRLGWACVRLVQKGAFSRVTHCEAILREYGAGVADIASSSLRDGGVRKKENVALDPGNWKIADVPLFDAAKAAEWFAEHDGAPYDFRGALATVLPGRTQAGHFFCNYSVGAAPGVLLTPECFTPAQFAAICFSLGRDVTDEFFNKPV
jgi:hypothetical protein